MRPLLSIAIATKDREQYCIKTIESILAFEDDRIQISISDNSSTTVVKDFVEKLASSQVVYAYDSGPVSSIENFNRAVESTTGEFIMLIGDDDAILPKAIEMAEWGSKNDVESIASKSSVIYYWPKAYDKYPDGAVLIPAYTKELVEVDVKKQLTKLVKSGLQNYLSYALPKTYHGLVKRSVLERIKEKTGHFYGGLSPDIYSAVAVACVAKNHYQIGVPMSIAGVCAKSTTADNMVGKHSGTLENIQHLRHRDGYVFDKRIPMYYSVNTIWAESGLKALEELGEHNLLKQFNMFYLLAQGKIHNDKFIPEIIKTETKKLLLKNNISNRIYNIAIRRETAKIYYRKICQLLRSKFSDQKFNTIENIEEIQMAIDAINQE